MPMQRKHIEKEWQQLQKQEQRFLSQNEKTPALKWQEKISKLVPEKLEDTLESAFYKAFELIFEKGTGILEKTYSRGKIEQDYKINQYAAEVRSNRRSLRVFGKKADTSRGINMAVSTVEGIGMGVLGMGIPDIPLFLGVLLKSIYEIALHYGFSYDTEEEQIFILKIIEAALSHEENLARNNMEINLWIRQKPAREFEISRSQQIRKTADALSEELLYLKFVQGLPIVGVVGGISDMVYQKKISEYAALKYKRRFLENMLNKEQTN